jgi:hypothetical protein
MVGWGCWFGLFGGIKMYSSNDYHVLCLSNVRMPPHSSLLRPGLFAQPNLASSGRRWGTVTRPSLTFACPCQACICLTCVDSSYSSTRTRVLLYSISTYYCNHYQYNTYSTRVVGSTVLRITDYGLYKWCYMYSVRGIETNSVALEMACV